MHRPTRRVETGCGDFSAVFESAFSRLRERVEPACSGGADAHWPARVAAAVRASFAFAVEDPDAATLLTLEALSRDPEGQAHHERLVAYFVEHLRVCRDGAASRGGGSPAIDTAIVGGLALLVARRLRTGREAELPELAGEAIEFVLTPQLGARRAREIAGTPVNRGSEPQSRRSCF